LAMMIPPTLVEYLKKKQAEPPHSIEMGRLGADFYHKITFLKSSLNFSLSSAVNGFGPFVRFPLFRAMLMQMVVRSYNVY
jgi:hypothetical protein